VTTPTLPGNNGIVILGRPFVTELAEGVLDDEPLDSAANPTPGGVYRNMEYIFFWGDGVSFLLTGII
jgi:hypothetical protein